MQQALQMMQCQMQGEQDVMAGRDTEAARAYKKQTEALALQGKQMEAQLRKDPKYVRAQEEAEREDREFRRKNPSGFDCEFKLSIAKNTDIAFGLALQFSSPTLLPP